METIEIQTLVDITRTRVNRPNQGSQLEYDQNRNFITLMQCIEIRSVVVYDEPPAKEIQDVKSMGFGSEYKGSHAVWTFRIIPDRVGVYNNINGPAGALIEDIDSVPIIKNLTETINIIKAIFDCKDPIAKNTIIKAHKGII
jgi:hypothetical protein